MEVKMPVNKIYSEINLAMFIIKMNIKANISMKSAFLLQMVGMMLNNAAFVFLWILFTDIFGVINGWGKWEVIGLQGIIAVVYGIGFAFFRGSSILPSYVDKGIFDILLTSPRNLYMRILTLGSSMSAFGDIIYGIFLLLLFCLGISASVSQILVLILLIPPTVLIFTNFTLVTSCISFYIPDSQDLAKNLFEYMFGPSIYPAGIYPTMMRFFFTFILPSIVIGGLPIETVTNLSIQNIASIWLISLAWFFIAVRVLKEGLKRYESGNLTGARVLD